MKMTLMKRFLVLNLHWITRKRNAFIIFLFFLIGLAFIQHGSNEYKSMRKHNQNFSGIERSRVEAFQSYRAYGTFGFRIKFATDPVNTFFFNSGVAQESICKIDTGEILNIDYQLQGKNSFIFNLRKVLVVDYSSFLIIFGSLLVLFYGVLTFKDKEFWKTMSSIANLKSLYFSHVLARAIIIILLFLFLTFSSTLALLLNGIHIKINIIFFSYIVLSIFVLLFFFSSGVLIGNIRTKKVYSSYFFALLFWIISFIAPSVLGVAISSKSSSITPLYKYEWDKIKIFDKYEKDAIKKVGRYYYGVKMTPNKLAIVQDFYDNEFKKVCLIEKSLYSEMDKHSSFYFQLSALIPTTAYISTSEEVGSSGLLNLLEFYDYSIKVKDDFMKFFIDRAYVKGNTGTCKVESFIKGSENIYQGKSRLPHFFLLGLLLTIGYTSGLFYLGYRKFKQRLYSIDKEQISELEENDVLFSKSKVEAYYAGSEIYSDIIYSFISGQHKEIQKSGYPGKMSLEIDSHLDSSKNRSFLFLGSPFELPEDMLVSDYISLHAELCREPQSKIPTVEFLFIKEEDFKKTIGELKEYQKGELLMAPLFMKNWDICLISDSLSKMPAEIVLKMSDRLESLAEQGKTVIYLVFSTFEFAATSVEELINSKKVLLKTPFWDNYIKINKNVKQGWKASAN